MSANPFLRPRLGPDVQVQSADDRIHEVRSFTMAKCRAALQVDGLQGTVRLAVERRMRALAKRVVKLR